MSGGGSGSSDQEAPQGVPGEGTSTAASPRPRMEGVEAEIDEYRLIEEIGEGGMGVIYKAEQRGAIRRVVALKVIKLGLDTKAVIARFEAERQALALMNHPNIARVFGAGSTPLGRPYFVMEFVPGEPITIYCDRHKLSIRHRLELFTKVCEAIQHAHTKGIIHRDLKASNVLVTEVDGRPVPKVIDFGVAKATSQRLTAQTLFTEQGLLIGTPAYASPEQAEGGADVDTRSDVYSLGVMLYELLTGALPFDPMKLRDLAYGEMQRVIREVDPPRPSTFYSHPTEASLAAAQRRAATVEELASALRHELEWIPLRAMRKERGERYQTVADFARDIGHYLAGQPLLAAPDSRMYRWRKAMRRNRGLVAAMAAVALALLLGTGVATWQALRARHQQDLAERSSLDARKRLAQVEASGKLLEELFDGIRPSVARGRDTQLMVDLLRGAEAQIEEHLPDPAWQPKYLVLLANGFRLLGEYTDAQRILDKTTTLARANYDSAAAAEAFDNDFEEVRTLLDALDGQGQLQLDLSKYEAAAGFFRESLDLARAHLPADDPRITDCLSNLGEALRLESRFDEAVQLQQEAFDRAEAEPARHPPARRATLASNLGLARFSGGDRAGAAEAYNLADTIYHESGETRTTGFVMLLRNRAALAADLGRLEEAIRLSTAAVDLRGELAKDVDPLALMEELELRSGYLARAGRLSEAADDRLEAVRLGKELRTDDRTRLRLLAANAAHAAWLLHEAGRLEEALPVLTEATDFYEEARAMAEREQAARNGGSGEDLSAIIASCEAGKLASTSRWAQISMELGNAEAALPVIRACLSRQVELFAQGAPADESQADANSAAVAASQWVLAEALLAQEDEAARDEALQLLLAAADGLDDADAGVAPTAGGRPSLRERILRRLVDVHASRGDEAGAQHWREALSRLGLEP